MTDIQLVSDIHLEFRGDNFAGIIKPSAPILCLLGDICACGCESDYEVYKKFIHYLSGKFKYIFHVAGNHEYYTAGNKNITLKDTFPGINLKIKNFLKNYNNVFYLNNDTKKVKIKNKTYVFVGTTLWTGVRQQDRKKVGQSMNDYDNIYMPNPKPKGEIPPTWKPVRKYNIEDMSFYHKKGVRHILKSIKELDPKEICVILTHHKPYRTQPIENILSQAYETDLIGKVIKLPLNVKLWGYGHTHVKDDIMINGVRVVSNPKGYPSQKTRYNNAFVVSV